MNTSKGNYEGVAVEIPETVPYTKPRNRSESPDVLLTPIKHQMTPRWPSSVLSAEELRTALSVIKKSKKKNQPKDGYPETSTPRASPEQHKARNRKEYVKGNRTTRSTTRTQIGEGKRYKKQNGGQSLWR